MVGFAQSVLRVARARSLPVARARSRRVARARSRRVARARSRPVARSILRVPCTRQVDLLRVQEAAGCNVRKE